MLSNSKNNPVKPRFGKIDDKVDWKFLFFTYQSNIDPLKHFILDYFVMNSILYFCLISRFYLLLDIYKGHVFIIHETDLSLVLFFIFNFIIHYCACFCSIAVSYEEVTCSERITRLLNQENEMKSKEFFSLIESTNKVSFSGIIFHQMYCFALLVVVFLFYIKNIFFCL